MTIKKCEEHITKLVNNRAFIRCGKLKDRALYMFDGYGDTVAHLRFSKDDEAVEISPVKQSKSRDCCNVLEAWFRDQGLRTVINLAGV
jgi:hypothetical protein